jgi:hypothetical protein
VQHVAVAGQRGDGRIDRLLAAALVLLFLIGLIGPLVWMGVVPWPVLLALGAPLAGLVVALLVLVSREEGISKREVAVGPFRRRPKSDES